MPQNLSPREGEILALVAAGLTSKAIAGRLGIGESTVNWHLANALRKLGAASRAEAVAIAMREGLLSDVPVPHMPPGQAPVAGSRWRLLLIATIAFLIAMPLFVASAVLSPTRMPPPVTPVPRSPSPSPAAITPSTPAASPTVAPTGAAAPATAPPATTVTASPVPPSVVATPVPTLGVPTLPALPALTGAPVPTPRLPEITPLVSPSPEILPLLPTLPRLP